MNKPFVLLDHVAVQFGEKQVFRDVSLELQRGNIAVVVGESGVGKSILLRAIAGQGPFTGKIEIDGKEPHSLDEQAKRPRVILVPQQAFLWDHLTAIENVTLVRRLILRESLSKAKGRAHELLQELDVENVEQRYPFRLSGGEQQRVSLARGLAADADLYLLDEITAHLDPRRRGDVAALLKELARKWKTLIVATHDRRFAQYLSEQPFELTDAGLHRLSSSQ